MCKILIVNRSAYYYWVSNGCIENRVDEQLNTHIKDIFYQYREVYDAKRIKEVLVQNITYFKAWVEKVIVGTML